MRITRVRNHQRQFWSDQLNHELRMETISALSVLVQLMLLISVGNAENKRCFSLMNLLKSDLRSRLGKIISTAACM